MEFLDLRKRNFFRKNEPFEQNLTNVAKIANWGIDSSEKLKADFIKLKLSKKTFLNRRQEPPCLDVTTLVYSTLLQ